MELNSSLALGWAYLQMICRPLREDTRHAAAAVVGMRNANRSFQAEVVGQDTLKLCLCETSFYHS